MINVKFVYFQNVLQVCILPCPRSSLSCTALSEKEGDSDERERESDKREREKVIKEREKVIKERRRK